MTTLIRRELPIPRSLAVRTAPLLLSPVLVLTCSGAPALAEQQPRPGGVVRIGEQVDVSGLHGIDVADIAPGYRESWLITVANERSESVTLGVRVDELVDSENGCGGPESRVDDSCEDGGELSEHLELHLGVPDNTRMFSVPLNEAEEGSGQIVTVPARGETEVVLGLRLPSATGNEVQTDSVEFVLVWRADAVSGSAPGSSEDGVELRSTVVGGEDSADLALTGARVMLLVGLAVALIAGGTLLLLAAGRGRGRRTADRTADR